MSTALRLVAENGRALRGAAKARRALRPETQLARVARELETLRLEAEVVAGLAQEMKELLPVFAAAVRLGEPIAIRALLREADIQAGYVYCRAANLGQMIARAASGGAA